MVPMPAVPKKAPRSVPRVGHPPLGGRHVLNVVGRAAQTLLIQAPPEMEYEWTNHTQSLCRP